MKTNTNKEINRNKFLNLIGTTEYRTLEEFPNYIITADGRVWSLSHGKFMNPSISYNNGYYQVHLKNDKGSFVTIKVHTLVANAFFGYRPANKNVNHKNCNKLDNTVENLEYVTPSENIQHAMQNGMIKLGDNHIKSTKTQENVVQALLDVLVGNMSKKASGSLHELSPQYINRVITGKLRRNIWSDERLAALKPF